MDDAEPILAAAIAGRYIGAGLRIGYGWRRAADPLGVVAVVVVIGGRDVGPNEAAAAAPGALSVTTCFPLIIAAWALASRAEFDITDIFGLIATEEEEAGPPRRPASSVLASVPGGSVIVFVPSGFVTRFSVDMGVEVAAAEVDEEEEDAAVLIIIEAEGVGGGGSMISMSDSPPSCDPAEVVEVSDTEAMTEGEATTAASVGSGPRAL